MTVEAAGFIDDIDPTLPLGTDAKYEGDDQLRNFKKSVQDSFPNITGAVTATHTELNLLDGVTSTTAELNYSDGVTSNIQTQLDAKEGSIQEIKSITGTVAANALTCGIGADSLYFRNAALGTGSASRIAFSALSLVVPSGATLGTIDAQPSRLVLLAINNAGTIELAIVNQAGGNDLSEEGVISTTAISAGSDTSSVFYSTTARTNVAYRTVGVIESTQTTAGTWAASPTLLQGAGGNALTAVSSQTWQVVTGSRAAGTTYYNTTGRPIYISISITGTGASNFEVAGTEMAFGQGVTGTTIPLFAVVPAGMSYQYPSGQTFGLWAELR